MELLFLVKFNNYYNRRVKRFETIDEYIDECKSSVIFGGIDFKPNDGVDTTQVINWSDEDGTPDYLLLLDANEIVSRWFVIEWVRIRKGQYRATLRRDVIADNYYGVIEAPCYVEKATITPNDIAIYNQEEISFNQIKTKETLLKDKSKNAWIVGYYAENTGEKTISVGSTSYNIWGTFANVSDFLTAAGGEVQNVLDNVVSSYMRFQLSPSIGINSLARLIITDNNVLVYSEDATLPKFQLENVPIGNKRQPYLQELVNKLSNYQSTIIESELAEANIRKETGIKENSYVEIDGVIYKITFNVNEISNETIELNNTGPSYNYVKDLIDDLGYNLNETIRTGKSLFITVNYRKITLSLSTVESSSYNVVIPATSAKLEDAPYKMFAIPLNKTRVYSAGTYFITPDSSDVLNISSRIAETLGSNLYDIQLLPYCPMLDVIIDPNTWLNIADFTNDVDYSIIKDGNNVRKGIILFPKNQHLQLR